MDTFSLVIDMGHLEYADRDSMWSLCADTGRGPHVRLSCVLFWERRCSSWD